MIQDSTNPEYVYNGELPPEDAPPPDLKYTYSGSEIEKWLAHNRSTSGGDHPECVEFVLRYLRATHVPAAAAGEHHLIVFWVGDAPPHTASMNTYGLDWQAELNAIAPMGVTIYTALCGNDRQAAQCWETMSKTTGGISVGLNNIDNLATTMIAVVKREMGTLDEYADQVRKDGADSEMEEILVDLGATCNE